MYKHPESLKGKTAKGNSQAECGMPITPTLGRLRQGLPMVLGQPGLYRRFKVSMESIEKTWIRELEGRVRGSQGGEGENRTGGEGEGRGGKRGKNGSAKACHQPEGQGEG